ncbi:MAG: class I SAM-dependent methyltransferase [Candidatus Obscuribacterales bacterium]|nr:class I SAM-dependent methyltransferase [Candidatus Obscuribacterales bacterium]
MLKQFDRIAQGYDLTNDLISFGMHRLWKTKAIKEMSLQKAGTYLDVCSGTGDLAMMIATQKAFEGTVIGLDFSAEMLNVAKRRQSKIASLSYIAEDQIGSNPSKKSLLKESGRAALGFKQGDAQELPFEDNCFDAAIISFGLRNLSDLQKGLNEMARVVKPGGKVLNLDLGQPDMPIFTPFFLFFFDKIVPLIGELVQQDRQAYTYLPESRKSYPHPQKLSTMFEAAGLIDVRWEKLAMGSVAMHVGTVK